MAKLALLPFILFCFASLIQGKNDICKLPIEKGTCGSNIESWAYDASAGRCVRFMYGGCGGNENRFRTMGICKRVCMDPPPKKKKNN